MSRESSLKNLELRSEVITAICPAHEISSPNDYKLTNVTIYALIKLIADFTTSTSLQVLKLPTTLAVHFLVKLQFALGHV